MTQVTNNTHTNYMSQISAEQVTAYINDSKAFAGSVQFAFAKLQLEQSQLSKMAAQQYMKKIEEIQQDQKEVAKFIEQARELQSQAKDKGEKACTTMPKEMVDYMNKHGLKIQSTGNDNLHNKDEWDYNLTSLTNYQETISNSTQTLMVYLQDYISQYNSYLQGAMSAINNASQVLTAVATGR